VAAAQVTRSNASHAALICARHARETLLMELLFQAATVLIVASARRLMVIK